MSWYGTSAKRGTKKMRRTCLLCDTEITRRNSSKEHLLLKTFGGRKTTRAALCQECNTRTGREWDSVLEGQLRRFTLLSELPEQTNKKRRELIRDDAGVGFLFKTGMRGGLEKAVELVHHGERVIIGDTRKIVEGEIRRRQRDGEISKESADLAISDIEAGIETETTIEFEDYRAYGGVEAQNSIMKSMLTTGCEAGLTPDDLLTGKAFLEGRTAFAMKLRGQVPIATYLPLAESAVHRDVGSPWIHCVTY